VPRAPSSLRLRDDRRPSLTDAGTLFAVSERETFESLVVDALGSLPAWVRERLENVEILVEEHPPPGEPALLGRYRGIPLTRRNRGYFGVLPDTITLYRSTIEHAAEGGELRRVIHHTIEHEVAHFFGISDDRLREIDAY
jgi:predicted Zn-dependent protease with MMP-like domain